MKNYVSLFIAVAAVFSSDCFAQNVKLADDRIASIESPQGTAEMPTTPEGAPKSYHVEENINMIFGGYTITYDVSQLSLVNTNDLGENNTRVVTPHFGTETKVPASESKAVTAAVKRPLKPAATPALNIALKAGLNPVLTPAPMPSIASGPLVAKKSGGTAYINFLETYERMAEKGYKSADIFKRLGNAHYFNGNLVKAAKWYAELLTMNTTFEPEVYFRYAKALIAIGKNDMAAKMMEKFDKQNP